MTRPLAILTLAILATAARAADPTPPPEWPVKEFQALLTTPEPTPEARAATARLIADLTSPDFLTRDAASKELAAKGPQVFQGLREAVAASADAELHARLDQYFPPGSILIPSNVPEPVARVVREFDALHLEVQNSDPVDQPKRRVLENGAINLLDRLGDEEGELFLRIVVPQETNEGLRQMLQSEMARRARSRALFAIAEGNLDQAENIFQARFSSQDSYYPSQYAMADYAALRALRLGSAFDPERELARVYPRPPPAPVILSAYLLHAAGRYSDAADIPAAITDEERLFWPCMVAAGRFEGLAAALESLPNNYPRSVAAATARMLVGNEVRAVEDIKKLKDTNPFTMILCNRTQDFLTQSQLDPDSNAIAMALLIAQLRLREALAMTRNSTGVALSIAGLLHDHGFNKSAIGMLHAGQPDPPSVDPPVKPETAGTYFEYAGLFQALRQKESAESAREKGFSLLDPLDAKHVQAVRDLNAFRQLHPEDISRYDAQTQELLIQLESNATEFHRLNDYVNCFSDLPQDPLTQREARFWFGVQPEDRSARERYKEVVRLMQGESPDQELQALSDSLVDYCAGMTQDFLLRDACRDLLLAVNRFHLLHRDQLARDTVQRCVKQSGVTMFWSVLGDFELESGTPAAAAQYYRRAAPDNLTDASLMYRLGVALARDAKSRENGEALMAYAPFLVLGNFQQSRQLADEMRRFQDPAAADASWELWAARCSRVPLYLMAEPWKAACQSAMARGDYSAALRLQEKVLFTSSDLPSYDNISVVLEDMANMALYHKCRALDALASEDLPTLADALNGQLNNGPPDPDLLEKTIPALRTADPAAAQKILQRALDRLTPVVQDYPEATLYQTQLKRLQALIK